MLAVNNSLLICAIAIRDTTIRKGVCLRGNSKYFTEELRGENYANKN